MRNWPSLPAMIITIFERIPVSYNALTPRVAYTGAISLYHWLSEALMCRQVKCLMQLKAKSKLTTKRNIFHRLIVCIHKFSVLFGMHVFIYIVPVVYNPFNLVLGKDFYLFCFNLWSRQREN